MRHTIFLVNLLLLSSWPAFGATPVLSFEQVYRAALSKNESIPIQESRTEQAKERVSQAFGTFFPRVGLSGSALYQDVNGASDEVQTTLRLSLTQPLFHGFRSLSTYRLNQAEFEAQKLNEQQTKLYLYGNVAQSYFSVLAAEKDLSNLHLQRSYTQKRIEELRERTKRGRSRQAELLTAQSQELLLKAQIQAAELSLSQTREQFAFLTGLPSATQLEDPSQKLSIELEPLQSYLNGMEDRPDLRALRFQVESAERATSVARSDWWPAIDGVGDLQKSKWDAGVTFTFSIFDAGITGARVSEAAARVKEREYVLSQARRSAVREIRTAYQSLASSYLQLKSLQDAVKTAELTYQEQNNDYRHGLTTNLDVLQALNALIEAQRALDRAKYQTQSSFAVLCSVAAKVRVPAGVVTSGPIFQESK